MRKDKLKINFQRIGALFSALLIVFVGVFGFVSSSVSAAEMDSSEPISLFMHERLPVLPTGDYPLGVSFEVYVSSLNMLVDVQGINVYGNQLNFVSSGSNIKVYDYETGWLDSRSRYLYFPSGFRGAYPQVLQVLLANSTVPDFNEIKFAQRLSYDFSFDYQFEFASTFGSYLGAVYDHTTNRLFYMEYGAESSGGLTGNTPLLVYDNGWIDEEYTFIFNEVTSVLPHGDINAVNFALFVLTNTYSPTFLDRVTSGLTAVIAWVGAVASAVISGPLSPLLGLVAVGIAVSAILLVIYLVRRFIWGA